MVLCGEAGARRARGVDDDSLHVDLDDHLLGDVESSSCSFCLVFPPIKYTIICFFNKWTENLDQLKKTIILARAQFQLFLLRLSEAFENALIH
jgi:hypothetical protein